MASDVKRILTFAVRRDPHGRSYGEARRNGRTFHLTREEHGWMLVEILAAPPRPARKAPRRMRRELADLGLVGASDTIEEIPVRARAAGTTRGSIG